MIPLANRTLPALAATALVALAACNKERTPAATKGSAAQGDSTVVATYAGKQLTMKELDQQIADRLYEVRQQALEQVVIEDLVKMAAEKRGMTEEEFLKAEIEGKVEPPSEEEMQRFWEQVKASGQVPPDATYEQVKDRIAAQLRRPQQAERARALFEELKKEANFESKLQPPRKEVAASGPSKGPENAPVTIVEFSDFQCPYCGRAADTVDQVMEAYPGKVQLVFRHFPLDFHKQAPKAAEAAMCAHDQNKFWEYHDVLFENQDKLQPEDLKTHAKAVGLDMGKFEECLGSNKYAETVKKDMAAGKEVGVTGTPAFFINGVMLSGAQPLEEFKKVIDQELQTAKN